MNAISLSIKQRQSSPRYSAEAKALFARMTAQPSGARKKQIDTFITGLKTASLWEKFDAFYLLASHDEQSAKLNWMEDGHNITNVNSTTFTTDRGFTGNGTSMYLDCNFNPSTEAVKYTQNSACIMAYANNANAQDGGAIIGIGQTTPTVVYSQIFARALDDKAYWQIKGNNTDNGTSLNSSGLFTASRTAESTSALYRNTTKLMDGTKSSAVAGNGNIVLLARNLNNGTIQYYSTSRIGFAAIGAGFSAGELSSFYTLLNTYLTAIGANA